MSDEFVETLELTACPDRELFSTTIHIESQIFSGFLAISGYHTLKENEALDINTGHGLLRFTVKRKK